LTIRCRGSPRTGVSPGPLPLRRSWRPRPPALPRLTNALAPLQPVKALAPSQPEKDPTLMTSRRRDPPPMGVAPSLRPRAPSPHLCHPSQPRLATPVMLGGGRLHGRSSLNGGDDHRRGWCARLLHCRGHGRPLFNLRAAAQRTGVGDGAWKARPARSGPGASGARG
jgi:hypothetical protein